MPPAVHTIHPHQIWGELSVKQRLAIRLLLLPTDDAPPGECVAEVRLRLFREGDTYRWTCEGEQLDGVDEQVDRALRLAGGAER